MEAAAAAASFPAWSDLPPELLGFVFTRLPSAYDCACSRGVCRSWRSAMRHHVSPGALRRRLPPWVVLPDGCFVTNPPADIYDYYPATLPEKATCVGSTDGWVALDDQQSSGHNYLLHNPFTDTTVPLLELDAIIGGVVPKSFRIRKVLMRSTPDDIVVVMPNNKNYPIVLVRPGKGAWRPKPHTAPFTRIIDVAFLGDKLYGITEAEDLISLDITFDQDGKPTVTAIQRIIKQSVGGDDSNDQWSGFAEADQADGDQEVDIVNEDSDESEDNTSEEEIDSDDDFDYDVILDGAVSTEISEEPKYMFTNTWYLVESRGKLLMVRHLMHFPLSDWLSTVKVEVLEADISAGMWVPVTGSLGGQALFLSTPFSKSIDGGGEIEEDAIYFMETHETFNMKSQAINAPEWDFEYTRKMLNLFNTVTELPTWIFPPELVV